MVGPLVQHAGGELLHPVGDAVLGDDRRAVAGDEVVDAVVDLRVHMVGTPGQHDDAPALTAGFVDDLAALDPDLCHMGLVLGVGGVGSLLHLLLGDAAEILGQDLLRHLMDEVLRTVDADVVVDELLALQLGAVPGQHLGVVGHDGAVIVVVAQPLVDVVGQAGVEDGIQMHLGQGLDVAVAELGRETGGVAGDGGLTGQIEAAAGHRAGVDGKAQLCPESMPEGQQLVHIQAERDADGAALTGHRLIACQKLLLVGVEVEAVVLALASDGLIAAVAGDELAAVGEGVDGELAVVAAAAALDADDFLVEVLQLFLAHHGGGGLAVLAALAQAEEGRTVSAHQTGDVGADDLDAHLLLEGAEDGFVVEGAALHDDLPAQLLGAGGADDLIQRILDDADGQARRDVLDGCAILLGLLDRAVHEHGAAAAEIHRTVSKKAEGRKLLDVVAQRLRKGLQKAAAAGGARLVQEDVADGTVLDLEALHVLTADVDDEVHVRHEVFRRREVGHRLHEAEVAAECVLHQLFAVAGGGHAGHLEAGVLFIELQQLLPDEGQRVAEVGLIVGVEDLTLLVHDHQLDGRRAGVDADVHRAALGAECHPGHAVGHMAGVESLILLLAGEQRRLAGIGGRGGVLVQRGSHVRQDELLVGVEGSAQRDIEQAMLGAGAGDAQRLIEALAQHGAEGQRPAQIEDVALNGASLCQTGDGLVDHGLVDTGGDVLGPRALIDEGLHVALGKDAAAGGDGVCTGGLFRRLVHLICAHLEQGRHLVDKSTRTAGTAAVHPDFGAVGQEQDLRILTAQLDDAVRRRDELFDCHPGGEHLLHEGHAAAVGQTHACRAGDAEQRLPAVQLLCVDAAQQLLRLLQNMAVVALICRI